MPSTPQPPAKPSTQPTQAPKPPAPPPPKEQPKPAAAAAPAPQQQRPAPPPQQQAPRTQQPAPQQQRQSPTDHDNPPPARSQAPLAKAPQTPVAGVGPPEPGLPIGERPHDKRDPQSAKFEAHAGPPHWNEPRDERDATRKPREEWRPNPSLDARDQEPPVGYYADGMSAPDEQRARAAWVEAHGQAEYDEATDQRAKEDKPTFDQHALAGGGAFVRAGERRQVPGVVPPTKRE